MVVYGGWTQAQCCRNLFVGLSFNDQCQHIPLSSRQIVAEWSGMVRCLDQNPCGLSIDGRATLMGIPDGIGQLLRTDVFQQIACSPGARWRAALARLLQNWLGQ